MAEPATPIRREPPAFRHMVVSEIGRLSPHMTRVVFTGEDLVGLDVTEPAASVRLLLPEPGEQLVIPEWNGNEFLLPGGSRPTIRTFTPRYTDSELGSLTLDIVVHDGGAASAWVASASTGAKAAVSGPGRGYHIDPAAESFVLAGDETAIPAISQLLETIPGDIPTTVIIEVARPDARQELPRDPKAVITWVESVGDGTPGAALLHHLTHTTIDTTTKVWVAGEASGLHRIRQHLFGERNLPRGNVTARGYWKQGR